MFGDVIFCYDEYKKLVHEIDDLSKYVKYTAAFSPEIRKELILRLDKISKAAGIVYGN